MFQRLSTNQGVFHELGSSERKALGQVSGRELQGTGPRALLSSSSCGEGGSRALLPLLLGSSQSVAARGAGRESVWSQCLVRRNRQSSLHVHRAVVLPTVTRCVCVSEHVSVSACECRGRSMLHAALPQS